MTDEERWAEIDLLNTPDANDEGTLSVPSEITDGYDDEGNIRVF